LTLSKIFHGDLEATSRGEMIAAGNPASGSAGYVAIEQVTGALGGQAGSFFLQHNGVMDHGQPSLTVQVIPASGTGDLVGLKGSMSIDIVDGRHDYVLDYEIG
jgi:hypothetical protein